MSEVRRKPITIDLSQEMVERLSAGGRVAFKLVDDQERVHEVVLVPTTFLGAEAKATAARGALFIADDGSEL
jgi:hypothetical protein